MKVKLLVNLTDVGQVGDEVDIEDDAVAQQYCELNYARQVDGDESTEEVSGE